MHFWKSSTPAAALGSFLLTAACVAFAQTTNLGIFTDESSVGQAPPGGKVVYDGSKGEYRITGGGANVWNAVDAFHFVWRKASGDVTLSGDV